MDSILSNISTFISNNTSLNLDSLSNSESDDNTQTFQYPSYSTSQQNKINSINSYIGVNCCMGKMKVSKMVILVLFLVIWMFQLIIVIHIQRNSLVHLQIL